jgi:hypothetical protein
MTNEDKYSDLIKIDNTGMAQKLYDIYVALSFLQNSRRIVKADDFSVACLLGTTPKTVQKSKKILYKNGFINYNTEEKILLIEENNIIADLSSIEIIGAD